MMIGLVVALGAVGSAVAIALLFGKKKPSGVVPVRPVDPDPGGDDETEGEKFEGTDPGDGGGAAAIVGKVVAEIPTWKAKLGDLWDDEDKEPEPEPEPDPPMGPDPYSPALHPTPGQYYQVVKNDTLWAISAAAYGTGGKYPDIVSDPANQWLAKPPATTWKGGLYARYDGWNTRWLDGNQYPVLYIP